MIQAQIMSGQIMSFDGSFEMKMPNQPQMVRMFKMPAMPFMMFHGPEMVQRFSTTPPSHSAKPNTWKSRMTASAMLIARMSGGKHSAQRFSYR